MYRRHLTPPHVCVCIYIYSQRVMLERHTDPIYTIVLRTQTSPLGSNLLHLMEILEIKKQQHLFEETKSIFNLHVGRSGQ